MHALQGQGQGKEKPIFQVMQVGDKLMDSRWVAKFHKRGHEVAKADRKHRWLRTSSVRMPIFGKNEKMLEEGERFVESNK